MRYFPYDFRPHQREACQDIAQTVADGGHLVMEAPTGSGKTVAILAGALEAAQARGAAVVYTTRTNSQQAQAVAEIQRIREHTGLPIRSFALQGRHHLCLKLEDLDDPEWSVASADELSHYCSDAKRRADENPDDPKGCSYWTDLQTLDDAEVREAGGDGVHTAESWKRVGRDHGFCPYEATKRLLAGADVVVAPYIYVFEPSLRRRLLEWMQRTADQVVLVVDEAHNLPEYLRRLFSPRLTRNGLRRALKEAVELDDPDVLPDVRASSFLGRLAEALERCVEKFCTEEDGFLPPFELEARLLDAYGTTTTRLQEAGRSLAVLGEIVKDRRKLVGKIPRSALSAVAGFLEAWFEQDEEASLKIVGRDPDGYLESFLVDTTRATPFLMDLAATVHASGTLEPLDEYRTALGLPDDTPTRVFPDPFGSEGLTMLCVRGLTTRYESLKKDPRLVDRLQEATARLARAARVKTAVFFPSHDLRRQFEEVGVFRDVVARHEERGMGQDQLMGLLTAHRQSEDGLLVGVMGGRLSEGIDYPGQDLEAMLLVGTPYPKPTAHQRALLQYYDRKTGHGWDYAVTAPAVRRLRQALGRIRRSPDDHGLVILLDERSGPLLGRAGYRVQTVGIDDAVDRLAAWDGRSV